MKKLLTLLLTICLFQYISANDFIIVSPDRNLQVSVFLKEGTLNYNVNYKGKVILEDSPLGMITNVSDFSKDLVFVEKREQVVNKTYNEPKIKKSRVEYLANEVH